MAARLKCSVNARCAVDAVAEELSEMARMLEKWIPEAQVDTLKLKDRKKRLKENM